MPFWVRMTRTSESILVLCHEPAAFFLPPFVNEILHVSNAGTLYLFNGQNGTDSMFQDLEDVSSLRFRQAGPILKYTTALKSLMIFMGDFLCYGRALYPDAVNGQNTAGL